MDPVFSVLCSVCLLKCHDLPGYFLCYTECVECGSRCCGSACAGIFWPQPDHGGSRRLPGGIFGGTVDGFSVMLRYSVIFSLEILSQIFYFYSHKNSHPRAIFEISKMARGDKHENLNNE